MAMEFPSGAAREAILDGMRDAVALLDHDWRLRYVNRAAERVLDAPATELVGRSVFDVMPDDGAFQEAYRGAIERGEPVRFEGFSRVLGRWSDTDALPIDDRLVILMREVTRRHRQDRVTELREVTRAALDPAQGPTDVLRSSLEALHRVTGFDVAQLWTREHDSSVFSLDAAEHGVVTSPSPSSRRAETNSSTTRRWSGRPSPLAGSGPVMTSPIPRGSPGASSRGSVGCAERSRCRSTWPPRRMPCSVWSARCRRTVTTASRCSGSSIRSWSIASITSARSTRTAVPPVPGRPRRRAPRRVLRPGQRPAVRAARLRRARAARSPVHVVRPPG